MAIDFTKPIDQLIEETLSMPAEIMDPVEAAAWQMREFMPAIERIMEKNKKIFKSDFFIVGIPTWNIVKKIWDYKIFPTHDCPTPTNNQTVFHYKRGTYDHLEHLWTIPDREKCQEIYDHFLEADESINELKDCVMKYMTGKLDLLTKKLNKEDERTGNVILSEKKV